MHMQVLGVKDTYAFEEHVCINDHCRFEKVHKSQWIFHKNDACPQCGSKRSKSVSGGAGCKPYLVPQNKFHYLGLKNVIDGRMFSDPVWCKLRGQSADPYGFKTLAEFERLRQVLEGALEDPDTSLYEIGFDNAQMYAFRDWSSGILGIRCALPLFHVLQLFDVM